MNILVVTNKVHTYAIGFQTFIETMHSLGHSVFWAADFSSFIGNKEEIPAQLFQIDIDSNPLRKCNIKGYVQLKKIIRDNDIDAVQCSTPIGGMLARFAAKSENVDLVIYAAHGFLFFKGAPFINQTLYKLEEKLLAHFTDVLVTINDEDYKAAQFLKLRSGRAPVRVHGAGVDLNPRHTAMRNETRRLLGIPEDVFVIVSVGELNKNKNNQIVIKSLARLQNIKVKYIICGTGNKRDALSKLSFELGIKDRVLFLGYRTDIPDILCCADAFVIPSFREGIPRSLLEAMNEGLPCIGARTRGIVDLIQDSVNGYICEPASADDFVCAITKIINGSIDKNELKRFNDAILPQYSKENVMKEWNIIYSEVLGVAKKSV